MQTLERYSRERNKRINREARNKLDQIKTWRREATALHNRGNELNQAISKHDPKTNSQALPPQQLQSVIKQLQDEFAKDKQDYQQICDSLALHQIQEPKFPSAIEVDLRVLDPVEQPTPEPEPSQTIEAAADAKREEEQQQLQLALAELWQQYAKDQAKPPLTAEATGRLANALKLLREQLQGYAKIKAEAQRQLAQLEALAVAIARVEPSLGIAKKSLRYRLKRQH